MGSLPKSPKYEVRMELPNGFLKFINTPNIKCEIINDTLIKYRYLNIEFGSIYVCFLKG